MTACSRKWPQSSRRQQRKACCSSFCSETHKLSALHFPTQQVQPPKKQQQQKKTSVTSTLIMKKCFFLQQDFLEMRDVHLPVHNEPYVMSKRAQYATHSQVSTPPIDTTLFLLPCKSLECLAKNHFLRKALTRGLNAYSFFFVGFWTKKIYHDNNATGENA